MKASEFRSTWENVHSKYFHYSVLFRSPVLKALRLFDSRGAMLEHLKCLKTQSWSAGPKDLAAWALATKSLGTADSEISSNRGSFLKILRPRDWPPHSLVYIVYMCMFKLFWWRDDSWFVRLFLWLRHNRESTIPEREFARDYEALQNSDVVDLLMGWPYYKRMELSNFVCNQNVLLSGAFACVNPSFGDQATINSLLSFNHT